MTNEQTRSIDHLAEDISEWHECALQNGETVPDFWDEAETSERLAVWLHDRGWRKP